MCESSRRGMLWVVGSEDLPGVYQVQGNISEICFFSEAEDQGQKQNIRDWVGVLEQAIMGSRKSGSDVYEIIISGTVWVVGRDY